MISVKLVLGPIEEAAVHTETGEAEAEAEAAGLVVAEEEGEEDAAEDTRLSHYHRYPT